jgi:hypothetical protein
MSRVSQYICDSPRADCFSQEIFHESHYLILGAYQLHFVALYAYLTHLIWLHLSFSSSAHRCSQSPGRTVDSMAYHPLQCFSL